MMVWACTVREAVGGSFAGCSPPAYGEFSPGSRGSFRGRAFPPRFARTFQMALGECLVPVTSAACCSGLPAARRNRFSIISPFTATFSASVGCLSRAEEQMSRGNSSKRGNQGVASA